MTNINRSFGCIVLVLGILGGCYTASSQPCKPLNRTTSLDDPQTTMEQQVWAFRGYLIQDEQLTLTDGQARDHHFISLARDAMESPNRVHGYACRWVISYAKVLRERIRIGLDAQIWYPPDYLEPAEMAILMQIASMDAQAICPRHTQGRP